MQKQKASDSARNSSEANSSDERRSKDLTSILYLLESKVGDFKDEIERSSALYSKVGEKTELTKRIESILNDPLNSMFKASSDVDVQVKTILDSFIKAFIVSKRNLISKAYRNRSDSGDLSYSISLKEDSHDNRTEIFTFFDWLYSFQYDKKYPVVFQIVPTELLDKIKFEEEISLGR
ncbi:MAG: hypothetical protein KBA16_00585 [Bacteroidia bacterium]|jgi:hypothetical protein|nr:hypothetical protein [Bacteroidia bacterium]MBP7436185.1 hypothetical protein [Bacteroidia bacterium]MBP7728126.1 hypothetical protein [Bacteroidia bacterium]MBP7771307.1 hypothetical protein [Bacteroidia bacterium]